MSNVVETAANALAALEPKAKTPRGAMALVDALYDKIKEAQDKGYTFPEIAKVLNESGCKVNASTLRQYFAAKKQERGEGAPKKRTRAKRKSTDAATETKRTPERESVI